MNSPNEKKAPAGGHGAKRDEPRRKVSPLEPEVNDDDRAPIQRHLTLNLETTDGRALFVNRDHIVYVMAQARGSRVQLSTGETLFVYDNADWIDDRLLNP